MPKLYKIFFLFLNLSLFSQIQFQGDSSLKKIEKQGKTYFYEGKKLKGSKLHQLVISYPFETNKSILLKKEKKLRRFSRNTNAFFVTGTVIVPYSLFIGAIINDMGDHEAALLVGGFNLNLAFISYTISGFCKYRHKKLKSEIVELYNFP